MPAVDIYQKHLTRSALLSSDQMPMRIPPLDVVRVLNEARISFVLAGAYGLAGWRKESRATEDVDVVVALRQVKKAVRVLLQAFPDLEPVELPVVVRLRVRGTDDVVIDVMKPIHQPYREVFKHTHTVTVEGQTYRVPSLEMAVVMKYSAITSLNRLVEDRYRDAGDFIRMVKNNPELNREALAELALLFPDGGKDVLELTRKALAGETLNI
jgi:hypothetical protein